jgi:hypothetical protein
MFGIKRLRRQNAALRDALEWYANSTTWRRTATNVRGEPRQWIKSPAAFDRGARAKFVLTQLDEPTAFVSTGWILTDFAGGPDVVRSGRRRNRDSAPATASSVDDTDSPAPSSSLAAGKPSRPTTE